MDSKVSSYIDQFGITDNTRDFLNATQKMYINGESVSAQANEVNKVFEPATGGFLTHIPAASASDIDRAVSAAQHAYKKGEWSQTSPANRERLLNKLADLVEEHAQTIGEIETIDSGKAISGCLAVDVAGTIDLLRYMAGWATKIEGATRPVSIPGQHFAYTLKEPVGVVAAIVPWNWPFSMAMWKIAAPLAVGCSVVLKPSEQTSLSMLYFAKLCIEAGLPPGALNIITGKGRKIGEKLISHPSVNKVSFTGSTPVGRLVGQAAIANLSHVTLELGGKSAMLVFDDADVDEVVEATQNSIFFNTGQVCSAGSRLYAQKGIYEKLISAIAKRASAMKIGPPLDPNTEMGPVINDVQYKSVSDYISLGVTEGARLVQFDNEQILPEGNYIPPTILRDTNNKMQVVQEEIFGPVLVAQSFETEQEGMDLVNDNEFGLAGSIWTKDLSRALRLVPDLEAGTVWVNTHDILDVCIPFGGVKNSGIGKDQGKEQLDYFLETKAVWIKID